MSTGELLTKYERSVLHPSSGKCTFPKCPLCFVRHGVIFQRTWDLFRINRCHQNLEKMGMKCTVTIYRTWNFKPKWSRKNHAYHSKQTWDEEDRQRNYNVKFWRFGQPLLLWKNYKYYITCGRVCSFRYLYAKCMRHIVICGLTSSTILFTLSHRGHDFRKKKSI